MATEYPNSTVSIEIMLQSLKKNKKQTKIKTKQNKKIQHRKQQQDKQRNNNNNSPCLHHKQELCYFLKPGIDKNRFI